MNRIEELLMKLCYGEGLSEQEYKEYKQLSSKYNMCRIEYNQDCAKWFVSERYERKDACGRFLYVGWRQISPYYKTEGWAKRWAARNKKMLTEQ